MGDPQTAQTQVDGTARSPSDNVFSATKVASILKVWFQARKSIASPHGACSMSTKINSKVAQRLGVRRFDASEYLRDEADIAAYLEAAAAEEDPRVLAAALGDVARARGMSELARKTGLTREALYRSLSAEGNPELSTLTKVLRALGMRLTIQPAAT